MRIFGNLVVGCASALCLITAACGSADTAGTSDFDQTSGRAPASGDLLGGGGSMGGENGLGTGGGPTGTTDLAACATQSATAEARPVYLVFMFDKSGSMTKDNSPKWDSSKAATKSFFESPQSTGVSASLTFFPDKETNYSCNGTAYDSPKVTMSALPSTSFTAQLEAQTPGGGTPTKAALEGAIHYAQEVAKGPGKDGNVAIVLVTDGIPQGCNGNSVNSVRDLAATVATTIPTYVIGVGDELTSLNDIAASGGTKNALIVSVNNPSQIEADFSKAIAQIKASALSCDYKIPAPPSGETFDRSKVNVQHIPDGGTPGTLGYNASCTGGAGWKYDDENNPSRVVLCNASCDAVKARAGKVDIVFGCATQGAMVK